MKTRGELTGLSMDYLTRKAVVTFTVSSYPADIETYKGKDLDIEFKTHREKRSLNANAYFHVLCGKMAMIIYDRKHLCIIVEQVLRRICL
jgi:hypothetical protein